MLSFGHLIIALPSELATLRTVVSPSNSSSVPLLVELFMSEKVNGLGKEISAETSVDERIMYCKPGSWQSFVIIEHLILSMDKEMKKKIAEGTSRR